MQNISVSELKSMIDGDDVFELINVLPEDDFQRAHVPRSVNIPVQDKNFIKRVEERVQGNRGRSIIVYCANTQCDASPKAAKKLEHAGFTNIMDFEAGMQGWQEEGYPVESGEARV